MTVPEELTPCPFCGSAGLIQNDAGKYFATCYSHECGCCVGEAYDRDAMPDHMFYDEDAATAAWNRRAAISPPIDADRARETAMRIACAAFDFMPNYSWGEQTTDEVHGAIQTAAYKTIMEATAPHPAPIGGRGEVCPACKGVGTETDYDGLGMRAVEVKCSRCNGDGRTHPAPAPGPAGDAGDLIAELVEYAATLEKSGMVGFHLVTDAASALAAYQAERDKLQTLLTDRLMTQKSRAEAAEAKVAALTAENEALNAVISESAKACGAFISAEASIEFKRILPGEITAKLQDEASASDRTAAALMAALEPFAEFWRANRGEISQHHSYESVVSAKLPWGAFIEADAAISKVEG